MKFVYYIEYNVWCFVITGEVVPVGATREGDGKPVAMVPGEIFVEPLSGKPVHVSGGYLSDTHVLPSGGGYQTLLDSNALACEARLLDVFRQYKDAATGIIIILFLVINFWFSSI